jgi:hypothetical protein
MSSRGRADIDPKGGQPYAAAAMSLVFHAAHPLVPTLRADVRLFQVQAGAGSAAAVSAARRQQAAAAGWPKAGGRGPPLAATPRRNPCPAAATTNIPTPGRGQLVVWRRLRPDAVLPF